MNSEKLYGITAAQLGQLADLACEIDGNRSPIKGREVASALHQVVGDVAGTDESEFYPNHEAIDRLEKIMCEAFSNAEQSGNWVKAVITLNNQSRVLFASTDYGTALYAIGDDFFNAASLAYERSKMQADGHSTTIKDETPIIPAFLRKDPEQVAA